MDPAEIRFILLVVIKEGDGEILEKSDRSPCCEQRCGTGTVTWSKGGTGTAINYGSGTGTRYKIMYLISFI